MVEPSIDDLSVVPDVSAQSGSFMTEDPCIHEQATAPWDTVVTALSRGSYSHKVTFLVSPGLALYRESFGSKTRIKGLSPAGMFGFAVPLKVGSNTRWWGAPLHEKGLPAMMPGGVHVDFLEGHQQLVALIDLELMRESMPGEFMDAIGVASRQHVLPASHDAVGRLSATLTALLDNAQTDSQALHHPQAVRSMEQDLLAAFRHSLALPTSTPRRVGRAGRQRRLERAIEYLRSRDTGSVTVADLCAAAQVTQRTLEYAFRENFGMSPLGFLQLRRYHAARRELLAADGVTANVKTIALNNGIYQMGRFAVHYKRLFGESPSQTLQRRPEKGDRCLLHPGDLALL